MSPPVYLDECVDHRLGASLRERGYVVATTRESGLVGASDQRQLEYATDAGLVLLSYNWRHFQRLDAAHRREGRVHGGIIALPGPAPLDRLTVRAALMLDWMATLPAYRSHFFRWGDLQQLLIGGYRPAGLSEVELDLALGR